MGENIVGRDPDVQVTLDATTVSRRHAKITVTGVERWSRIWAARTARSCAANGLTAPCAWPIAIWSASDRCR